MVRQDECGGLSTEEWHVLKDTWSLSDADVSWLQALLHFAKVSETWNEFVGRTGYTKYRAMKWLTKFLDSHNFDEGIRWEKFERSHLFDRYTFILDHTNVAVRWKPTNQVEEPGYAYTSGFKGVSYKYQVCTTLQSTPISLSPCQPGRRTDIFNFVPPFQNHVVNDFGLLDGGYPGLNGHCQIPIRKPVHRELDPECKSWNRVLARARSRVERHFAVVKRYQILRRTSLEMETHEKFARLIFLVAHVLQHHGNSKGDTRYVPSCVALAPGIRCACSWHKRPREE